jgi:hypothetical protein
MNERQKRENERNIRSNDFLQENKADFAVNKVANIKIPELKRRVAKSQEIYQKQIAGGGNLRQNYTLIEDYYDDLRDEMRDVRGFARSIAQTNPGFDDKFRIPSGNAKRKIIAAARVFSDEAEEVKETFLDCGMDEDFIADLRAKADTLEQALNQNEAAIGETAGTTDALGAEISEASQIVEFLNPIVRRLYRNNPDKLTGWIYASKIERHTPKPRKPSEAPA